MPKLLSIAALFALGWPLSGQLELPDQPRPAPTREAPEKVSPKPSVDRPGASKSDGPAAPAEADADEHPELERLTVRFLGATEEGSALDGLAARLLTFESGGRAVLVEALDSHDATVVVAAGRALLSSGRSEDVAVVVQRVRERLPTRAIAPLLRAVRENDPIRGGPALLVDLLDHSQSAMRRAARYALVDHPSPDLLPRLVVALTSRRSETRQFALQVAAAVDDAAVLHLLTDRLGDSSSRVAAEAAAQIAVSRDARAVDVLRGLAFDGDALGADGDRRIAYALLALVEREDTTGEALLGEEDTAALLAGLRSHHPARKGASAIALAGVGFRSERPDETQWLDREVTHELVKIVGGAVFHSDFSSLQEPAVRRLALLSGSNFGSDGPGWQSWWAREVGSFRARRATLTATPEDAVRLRLTVRSGELAVQLLGPDAQRDPQGPAVLYLDELEARDLLGVVRRSGLLSAVRLPGRTSGDQSVRHFLQLALGERSKDFSSNDDPPEEWFADVLSFSLALEERNLWQRYADSSLYGSQRELWLAEREWWGSDVSDAERGRRLIDRILGAWMTLEETRLEDAFGDLERLYGDSALRSREDQPLLQRALGRVPADSPIAHGLVELVLLSLADSSGAVPAVGAQELLQSVLELYGELSGALVSVVLRAAPPEVARVASADPRPLVRELSAEILVSHADEDSRERFRGLFDDRVPSVQAAAARAAGQSGDETWRAAIVDRALSQVPSIRAAALRAAGHLGGTEIRALLIEGLSSRDQPVQQAAADGLAQLGDPLAIPVLISLLAEGPGSPLYAPGRDGLLRLGDAAWPALMRTVHAGRGPVRRDAAFLLAQQGVAEVASTLLGWLTEDPNDARVAHELAVLTCIDMRNSGDPANAWWEWWDLVVHDDAVAWLRTALERARIDAPPVEDFRDPRSAAAVRSLEQAARSGDDVLAERAQRELALHAGLTPGAPLPEDQEPR